jgi:predicted Fe-Mo cluster-binding NifX family protein
MTGQPTWLETERQEGVVQEAGRPALGVVSSAGVRAFVVPKRWKSRQVREAKPH